MKIMCKFHADRVYPPRYHAAFVLYKDSAGIQAICKESFDNRLDNADEDPSLEPQGFFFIVDSWEGETP